MNEHVFALLADTDADADAIAATAASIRAESAAPVLVLGAAPPSLPSEASAAGPQEVLAHGGLVVFARPGDRLVPGALEHRLRPLAAHPTAALSIAGVDLVDDDGEVVLHVKAPLPAIDPAELLLRRRVEAAAVAVRADVLDADAFDLLARPHGDAVVWSRLTRAHGAIVTGETAATVRFDRDLHAPGPERAVEALLTAAAEAGPDDELGDVTVRRELLRRLFVDGEPEQVTVDLAELLGPGAPTRARAAAVIADLQWALERQRDALVSERLRWPLGEVDPADALSELPDAELLEMRAVAIEYGTEITLRDVKIRRLEAEIYRRDALLGVDSAPAPAEEEATS